GRPRREGADEEILSLTLAMLREHGYRELNVDVVSERTGIAKTTIYRRWPSKGALVAAAIAPIAPPKTDDIDAILEETAAVLALLDAEAMEAIRIVLEPRRAMLQSIVGAQRTDELLGAMLVRLIAGEALAPGTATTDAP
ncbi:MAG: TetR/AcrR family transcriptional regulator, partial [Thermoanaerobaculia bacterium]